MKKKIISLSVVVAAISLVACGPSVIPSDSTPKDSSTKTTMHQHTFDYDNWKFDDNQHWHEATCEHKEERTDLGKHSLKEDKSLNVNPTHTKDGKTVRVCSVCGYQKEKILPAVSESVWVEFQKDGSVRKEKCEYCDDTAYYLFIGDATGGPKTDNAGNPFEWNDKSTDTDPSKAVAEWWIGGTIFKGKYAIALEAFMPNVSYSTNYFGNHAKTHKDKIQSNNPDKESESDFRYSFQIDDGEIITPNNDKTWGELGYQSDYMYTAPIVVNEIDLPDQASKFKVIHGDIGYGLYVKGVRLIKLD